MFEWSSHLLYRKNLTPSKYFVDNFRHFLEQRNSSNLEENVLDTHIVYHYHSSPSIREVREKTGVSYGKLYRTLQKHGVKPYRRQKASRQLVPVYHSQGMNIEQIAALTNYTPRNVRNIIKEKRV